MNYCEYLVSGATHGIGMKINNTNSGLAMSTVKIRGHIGVILAAGIFSAIFSTEAAALCTFGGPTSEPSLQQVMNDRLTVAPDAATACLTDSTDAYWTANNGAAATILVEIAGFSNQNTLGLYDMANPSQRIEVFNGTAGSNASRTISVSSNGSGASPGRARVRRPGG